MSALGTILISKIAEALITEENVKFLIDQIKAAIGKEPSEPTKDAIEDLKTEQSDEMLEYVGKVLESTGDLEPDEYAKVLINNTNIA